MKWFICILMCIGAVSMIPPGSMAQQNSQQLDARDLFSDFGVLPAHLLEMEPDHNYPYEFLLKESSVRFTETGDGIEAIIDHLVRIKIYSDDPLEIAEASMIGIPYYQDNNLERISNLEGNTYLPDGSTSQLDTGQATSSELNSRYNILEFEMPDATDGAVLEYKYTVNRRYIEELPDFYFAHQVPTKKAAITLQNEQFLRYDSVVQHADFDIEYTRQEIDTSSIPPVFTYSRPDPILVEKWEADDVPAVDQSAYISSVDDIRAKIKFMISEFGIPRQPLENSWELVAAQIRRNADPEAVLERQDSLKQAGKKIQEEVGNDPVQVQDSIFFHINRRSQYNGLHAVFAEDGLNHVLEQEPADQAEINMALLAMLRGAGIEAYPLYISGRDYGRINQSFPSLYQFNRMLVYTRIGEQNFVMDASFRFSKPGLIPVESYNEQGFILKENSYSWIDISPDKSKFDLNIFVDAELSEEGHLSGTLNAATSGYPAQQILSDLNTGKTESEVAAETFLDVYPEAEIEAIEIRTEEYSERGITVSLDFEIENYATSFSDGLEIRPMIVGYLFNNPFESSQRRVPITLDAPEKLLINYKLDIPDGYGIEEAGEARQTQMQGAELNEQYAVSGSTIRYSFEIDISRKDFPADVYSQLRRMYERWVELSNSTWFIEKRNL